MVGFQKTLAITVWLFVLSGCTTLYNPATGRRELILIDSATESAIGKNAVASVAKNHQFLDDPLVQARLERIGRKVSAASDRTDMPYTFKALADKELNAMTLPGGYIYVNKGLLDALDDDELAYVLGHEVGHVAARHIAKKLQANMAYQLLLGVAFAGMGERSAAAGQAARQGADLVYSLAELSYSRQDEYEADRLGVKYTQKAGFNPRACLSALGKLKNGEGRDWKLMQYFRTHPYVDDRIKALEAYLTQLSGGKQ